jgi:hypothetical protein
MAYARDNVEQRLEDAMVRVIQLDSAASNVTARRWRTAATVEQYPVYLVHCETTGSDTQFASVERFESALLSVGCQTDIMEDTSATTCNRMLGNIRGILRASTLPAALQAQATPNYRIFGVDLESGTQDQSSERVFSRSLTARVSLSY